jgi:hypothetical protein
MLAWWRQRIERADLAMRRPCGTMIWVRDRELDRLPLPWARAENSKGAEIYIRPARGSDWPLLFLDDLPVHIAIRAVRRYASLAIQTSPAGGCHLWLATAAALDERQRHLCQRHIARLTGADKASTSGEHLGRLAGFKNHKRHGAWVNVLSASDDREPWCPPPSLADEEPRPPASDRPAGCRRDVDRSPSGLDWAWTCRELKRGLSPELVQARLVTRCRSRRRQDAERYARRTVERAVAHLAR